MPATRWSLLREKQEGGGYLGPAFVCGHRWEASPRKGPGDGVWWCLSSGEQGACLCEGAKGEGMGKGLGMSVWVRCSTWREERS